MVVQYVPNNIFDAPPVLEGDTGRRKATTAMTSAVGLP
jgi:hypothetical protein